MRSGRLRGRPERVQHALGMLFATNEQVRDICIRLIIDQRAAIDTADVQTKGGSDGRGRAIVPFILPAIMQVNVGLTAHDRHCLCAGGTHRDAFSA